MAMTKPLCRGILKGNSVTKMRCNSKLLIDAFNLKMKIMTDCREKRKVNTMQSQGNLTLQDVFKKAS